MSQKELEVLAEIKRLFMKEGTIALDEAIVKIEDEIRLLNEHPNLVLTAIFDMAGEQHKRDMASAPMKREYHGWISIERGGEGFKDFFHCESLDTTKGEQVRHATFRDPAQAVDFWDRRVGKPVMLQDTPLGAYRVFTY